MNKRLTNIVGVCVLPFLVFFIFYFAADGFGFHTIPIIISQCMVPTTLGFAMACVMPAGLMDFSPGARLILGAIAGGLMGNVCGIPGLIIGSFIGAMAGGILIALLYRYLRIPSMVVSLGVVLIMEAFTERLAMGVGGASIVKIPERLSSIASYPNNVILTLIAGLILYYILYKTKLGCQINAVGNDEALLKNMGVNVETVKFKAFAVSGIFCFFAAMMQICYSGSVQSVVSMGTMTMVFKPMMGVLIALQLIKLFNNMPLMIFVGELVIQTVFNGFIALGLTDSIQNIILGFFLLVVMGVSENSSRVTEMMRRNKVRKQALAKN